jgi:hypothetical protein
MAPPDESVYEEDENLPELPPVLPEEELDDLEGEEVDLSMTGEGDGVAPDVSRKRRGSKRRLPPETVRKQAASRAMDIADWIDAVEHQYGSLDQPGVKLQLERLSPQYKDGVTVGGILDAWESRKPNYPMEVIEEWGGGVFRLKVQVNKMGQPPRNLKKQFEVGGVTKVKTPKVPWDLTGGPATAGGQPSYGPPPQHGSTHPMVEKRAMDIVSDQMADLRKRANERPTDGYNAALMQQLEGTYRATGAQVAEAVAARAQAQEAAAARQVQLAEQREAEARGAADQARLEVERLQRETTEKIARATAESHNMLGVLLPTFSENASRQVDSMTQTFLQREARIETQHAKEVDALYRQHESELRQGAMQHQAEITRLETVYTGQLQMLQTQLQMLHTQLADERRSNDQLRNEQAQLRTEQVTNLLKQADPIEKLQQLGSLRELVGEILPGGGGEGDGLSDEAPDWMKMINSVAGSLGPAIGQIIEARNAGAQPQQPQLTPQQLAMLQQQQLLAQQQQQGLVAYGAGAPAPARPARAGTQQAIATPQVAFDRHDLESAVDMLESIRNSGTPPADAASAATKHLPHDMLRELARRTPAKVVEQLEAAGILKGQLLTDDGKTYVVEFLQGLRQYVR